MADPNANMTQSTPQEIIISVIAGLLAPLLAIFLVVQLIRGIQEKHVDTDTSEAANKVVVARIKPFATLAALDASAPKVEQTGEQVFTAVCTSCHTPGALGAPKFNSKSDWGPRIGQGYDTLVKHALEGIRQMPARGGSPDLSDIEVARAVAYMANSGGASFKEPAAAAPAAGGSGGGKIDLVKGKATYEATCVACHGTGVAGAPKFGDKAAWAPRIKQEFETLYQNAIKGKNAMPPKGGNASLTDGEMANAVAYLVKEAGGKIPDQAPGAATTKSEKSEPAHADKAPAPNTASAAATPAQHVANTSATPAPKTVAASPAITSAAKPAPAVTAPESTVPAKPAMLASGKGEAVYKQTCTVCHTTGVAGAPKLGDKVAWGPRITKGMEALYTSGLKGIRGMPPKGGNPSLVDADVKAAIDYMVGQAK